MTYLNVFQKCHRAFFIDLYGCRAGIPPRDHEVDRVGGLDGALPLLRYRLPVLGKLHHATRVHDSVAEGVGVVPAQGQVWSLAAFFLLGILLKMTPPPYRFLTWKTNSHYVTGVKL